MRKFFYFFSNHLLLFKWNVYILHTCWAKQGKVLIQNLDPKEHLQIGHISDSKREKLVEAVAEWLKTAETPAHVSLLKHAIDEVFYEAHIRAGEDETIIS